MHFHEMSGPDSLIFGFCAVCPRLIQLKTPKGGDRRPTLHSRRFCRSVCGRTKSFRRSRNVKGNFAWGSYGGFSAGFWRVLGTFSAESRHDLGEISPPLAMRSLIGDFEGFASRFLAQKLPKASEKASRGRPNGHQDGEKVA